MGKGGSLGPSEKAVDIVGGEVGLDDTLRVPAAVTFCAVEGELVLLNLERGLYYGLNAVGTRAWALLVEGATPRRVSESMADEYEVSPDVLERDLLALFGSLVAEQLLTPSR